MAWTGGELAQVRHLREDDFVMCRSNDVVRSALILLAVFESAAMYVNKRGPAELLGRELCRTPRHHLPSLKCLSQVGMRGPANPVVQGCVLATSAQL